jgi:hypothetical protein
MKEEIYHMLGLCGEHSHPNLINVTFIVLIGVIFIAKKYGRDILERWF